MTGTPSVIKLSTSVMNALLKVSITDEKEAMIDKLKTAAKSSVNVALQLDLISSPLALFRSLIECFSEWNIEKRNLSEENENSTRLSLVYALTYCLILNDKEQPVYEEDLASLIGYVALPLLRPSAVRIVGCLCDAMVSLAEIFELRVVVPVMKMVAHAVEGGLHKLSETEKDEVREEIVQYLNVMISFSSRFANRVSLQSECAPYLIKLLDKILDRLFQKSSNSLFRSMSMKNWIPNLCLSQRLHDATQTIYRRVSDSFELPTMSDEILLGLTLRYFEDFANLHEGLSADFQIFVSRIAQLCLAQYTNDEASSRARKLADAVMNLRITYLAKLNRTTERNLFESEFTAEEWNDYFSISASLDDGHAHLALSLWPRSINLVKSKAFHSMLPWYSCLIKKALTVNSIRIRKFVAHHLITSDPCDIDCLTQSIIPSLLLPSACQAIASQYEGKQLGSLLETYIHANWEAATDSVDFLQKIVESLCNSCDLHFPDTVIAILRTIALLPGTAALEHVHLQRLYTLMSLSNTVPNLAPQRLVKRAIATIALRHLGPKNASGDFIAIGSILQHLPDDLLLPTLSYARLPLHASQSAALFFQESLKDRTIAISNQAIHLARLYASLDDEEQLSICLHILLEGLTKSYSHVYSRETTELTLNILHHLTHLFVHKADSETRSGTFFVKALGTSEVGELIDELIDHLKNDSSQSAQSILAELGALCLRPKLLSYYSALVNTTEFSTTTMIPLAVALSKTPVDDGENIGKILCHSTDPGVWRALTALLESGTNISSELLSQISARLIDVLDVYPSDLVDCFYCVAALLRRYSGTKETLMSIIEACFSAFHSLEKRPARFRSAFIKAVMPRCLFEDAAFSDLFAEIIARIVPLLSQSADYMKMLVLHILESMNASILETSIDIFLDFSVCLLEEETDEFEPIKAKTSVDPSLFVVSSIMFAFWDALKEPIPLLDKVVLKVMDRIRSLESKCIQKFECSKEFKQTLIFHQILGLLSRRCSHHIQCEIFDLCDKALRGGLCPVLRQVIEAHAIALAASDIELLKRAIVALEEGSSTSSKRPVDLSLVHVASCSLSEIECGNVPVDWTLRVLKQLYLKSTVSVGQLRSACACLFVRIAAKHKNVKNHAQLEDLSLLNLMEELADVQQRNKTTASLLKKLNAVYDEFQPLKLVTLEGILDFCSDKNEFYSWPLVQRTRDIVAQALTDLMRRGEPQLGQQIAPKFETPALGSCDFQEKIDPLQILSTEYNEWCDEKNPRLLLQEAVAAKQRQSLIVLATFIDKAPNLGGLARTCEIFSTSKLVVPDLKIVKDKMFTALSVTAHEWLPIEECTEANIESYILDLKQQGYTIVGLEQTSDSVSLENFEFPEKTAILLGTEKLGIPARMLDVIDYAVEIPQFGVCRSLNVHVSAAITIWQYSSQHIVSRK